jgi:serine/threonine protein kinase
MEIGDIVGGKYQLIKKLGSGSFGTVFSVAHIETRKEYAAKVEYPTGKRPQLLSEGRILKQLQGSPGIPTFYLTASETGYSVMILELLGPSLHSMMQRLNKSLQLSTVLNVTDQMIRRVEFMHGRNFLHRDIKPDNFCIGLRKKKSIVYAVDFGLSKKYRDPKSHQHIPYKENKSLTGTARFASINSHMGLELSRRDDLESVCYVAIYMALGELPWQGTQAATKQEKYRRILERKNAVTPEMLCKNIPGELCTFLKYCRSLRFEERPDYDYCARLLVNVARRENFDLAGELVWKAPTVPSNRSHSVKSEKKSHRRKVKNTRARSASPLPPTPQNPSIVSGVEGTEDCKKMPEITNRARFSAFRSEAALKDTALKDTVPHQGPQCSLM